MAVGYADDRGVHGGAGAHLQALRLQHCNIVSLADKPLGLTLAFRMTSEMSVR
jgi:hypothetical protein